MKKKPDLITDTFHDGPFTIRWTTEGERYRWVIMRGPHIMIVCNGYGLGVSVKPTKKRMKAEMREWKHMTGLARIGVEK
jgi:hypothetical protein